jgi:hypothetical protein
MEVNFLRGAFTLHNEFIVIALTRTETGSPLAINRSRYHPDNIAQARLHSHYRVMAVNLLNALPWLRHVSARIALPSAVAIGALQNDLVTWLDFAVNVYEQCSHVLPPSP